MLWSFLCLSQVRIWTSNVICYGLFCVCHKSGCEPLTSYVMVFLCSHWQPIDILNQNNHHINRFHSATFLCLSQVRTWTSNVICYGLLCVCHKSGLEPLTSYVMVFLCSHWQPIDILNKNNYHINRFHSATFCVCHKSGPEPLTSYLMVFFVFVTSQGLNL
jgi:hypothetical protein